MRRSDPSGPIHAQTELRTSRRSVALDWPRGKVVSLLPTLPYSQWDHSQQCLENAPCSRVSLFLTTIILLRSISLPILRVEPPAATPGT